jgi:hypothetical protein
MAKSAKPSQLPIAKLQNGEHQRSNKSVSFVVNAANHNQDTHHHTVIKE